jgi:hypothetical protein
MKDEYKLIQEILLNLMKKQRYQQETEGKCKNYDKFQEKIYPIYEAGQIQSLMDINSDNLTADFCNYNYFLYLPPIEGQPCVPILLLKCNLKKSEFDISYYVMLLKPKEGEKPDCVGFRFEGSEAENGEECTHDYWHMQLVSKIDTKIGLGFPSSKNWLSTSLPCVPVKAKCPVSLLLCLLVSLYGPDIFSYLIDISVDEKYKLPLKDVLHATA